MKDKEKIIARIREKASKRLKELESGKWYKPTEGENIFRVVPLKNDKPPYTEFFVKRAKHFGLQTEEGVSIAPECLEFLNKEGLLENFLDEKEVRKVKKYGCPVCKLIERLSSVDQATASRMVARESYDIQVYLPDTKSFKIWSVSRKIIRALLAIQKRKQTAMFIDPEEGILISVEATGTGRERRYTDPVPDSFDPYALPDDWKERCYDIFYKDNDPRILSFSELLRLIKINYPMVKLYKTKKKGG